MSLKLVTFEEASALIGDLDQGKKLYDGYTVAKGKGTPELFKAWLDTITPDKEAITRGVNAKVSIDGDLSLPIGLSIVTGGAGSGKTSWLDKEVVPNIPDSVDASYLKFGEPGYYLPYSVRLVLTLIQNKVELSIKAKKPGIILIDSLLGAWSDPEVTVGFATGRGGSSLGVPVLLQTLGQYALSKGFRIVAVLHPLFADPEVIENGISGVSSFFLNKDNNTYIIRDYEVPSDKEGVSLKYMRRERVLTKEGGLSLLTTTIGGED